MEEQLRRDALEYHRVPTCGKISVTPTKSLVNQRDLALAYSPRVAYACLPSRTLRVVLLGLPRQGSCRCGLPLGPTMNVVSPDTNNVG
jgi:hypothetical protein